MASLYPFCVPLMMRKLLFNLPNFLLSVEEALGLHLRWKDLVSRPRQRSRSHFIPPIITTAQKSLMLLLITGTELRDES